MTAPAVVSARKLFLLSLISSGSEDRRKGGALDDRKCVITGTALIPAADDWGRNDGDASCRSGRRPYLRTQDETWDVSLNVQSARSPGIYCLEGEAQLFAVTRDLTIS